MCAYLVDIEGVDNQRTQDMIARTSSQLSQQLGRVAKENSELKMAREAEQGGLT